MSGQSPLRHPFFVGQSPPHQLSPPTTPLNQEGTGPGATSAKPGSRPATGRAHTGSGFSLAHAAVQDIQRRTDILKTKLTNLKRARENCNSQVQGQTPKLSRIQLAPQLRHPNLTWTAPPKDSGGCARPTVSDAPRQISSHVWGDVPPGNWKQISRIQSLLSAPPLAPELQIANKITAL